MGKSGGLNQSKLRKRSNKKNKPSAFLVVFGICIFLFVVLYVYAFIRATGMKIPQIEHMRKDAKIENIKIQKIQDCIIRCKTVAGVQEIPLEDFLVQALGASIDMEYELETLKAQIVLLRGNCVRIMEIQNISKFLSYSHTQNE